MNNNTRQQQKKNIKKNKKTKKISLTNKRASFSIFFLIVFCFLKIVLQIKKKKKLRQGLQYK